MQITLVTVGKIKEQYLKEAINEYIKRLSPYSKINIIEVMDEPIVDNPSKKEIEKAIQNFSPPSLVQQSWTQISRKRNKSSMNTSIFSLSPRMRRKSLVLC